MRKYIPILIAVTATVAVISFLFAPAPISASDLDIAKINAPPSDFLTYKQLEQDIKTLEFAFETTYEGKIAYPEEYQTTLTAIKEIKQNNPKGMETKLFYEQLSQILSKFPDGHLAAYQQDPQYTTSRSLASASTPTDSSPSPKVSFTTKGNKKILITSLPTFLIESGGQEFIQTFSDNLPKADRIILDLRGNSGGYQHIALGVAAKIWGEQYRDNNTIQYFPSPIQKSVALRNNSTYQLWRNFNLLQNPADLTEQKKLNQNIFYRILRFNEYAPGSLGKTLYAAEDFAAHTVEDINVYDEEESQLREKGFNKPIAILIDNQCASACESLLEALEKHPHITLVGQRTSGSAQFGAIGVLKLPHSQVSINIATAFITYKDKRRIERIGYPPHILVSDDEDAFKRALSAL